MEDENDIRELKEDLKDLGFLKPNCYKCKFRKELGWSAHSQCVALNNKIGVDISPEIQHLLMVTGKLEYKGVKFHEHGVKNGWAEWPSNFDPCWLEDCSLFEPKEEK